VEWNALDIAVFLGVHCYTLGSLKAVSATSDMFNKILTMVNADRLANRW